MCRHLWRGHDCDCWHHVVTLLEPGYDDHVGIPLTFVHGVIVARRWSLGWMCMHQSLGDMRSSWCIWCVDYFCSFSLEFGIMIPCLQYAFYSFSFFPPFLGGLG